MMKRISNKAAILLMLAVGLVTVAATALVGIYLGLRDAQRTMDRTVYYLERQCVTYREIIVADEVKSLVRLTEQAAELAIAMQEMLDRRDMARQPQLAVFEDIVKREPYSVEEKSAEIVRRVKLAGITRFLLLFKGSRSRSELVATFMAVLELCRKHVLRLAGGPEDCMVSCEKDSEV